MNSIQTLVESEAAPGLPDTRVSVRKLFGIDSDMEAPAYSHAEEHVPDLDPDYLFRPRYDARDPRRLRL